METMGRHVISELWGCDFDKLNDMDFIEKTFVNAALKSGAEVREVAFHKFAPQGVSGVVIISESHLTIHSFPEHGYASIDVYTCGDLDLMWLRITLRTHYMQIQEKTLKYREEWGLYRLNRHKRKYCNFQNANTRELS